MMRLYLPTLVLVVGVPLVSSFVPFLGRCASRRGTAVAVVGEERLASAITNALDGMLEGKISREVVDVVIDYPVQLHMATEAVKRADLAEEMARLLKNELVAEHDWVMLERQKDNAMHLRVMGLMHMPGIIEFAEIIVKDEFWAAKWRAVDCFNATAVAEFNQSKQRVEDGGRLEFWTALASETDPSVLAGTKMALARKALAVFGMTGPADVTASYDSVCDDVHELLQDAQGRFLLDADRVGFQTAKFLDVFCGVIPIASRIIGANSADEAGGGCRL
ncbi:hypothetical protein JKP88DRAFT_251033 [Tribonema minus]|uniref:Uncharacterized protein n=1 Tax=Tribonema minus TaxID=303371 RepID=A0A835ZJX3_9STRA|nr:hypothetical protein JKP88DRAFT_251033 [Tribonema minus]